MDEIWEIVGAGFFGVILILGGIYVYKHYLEPFSEVSGEVKYDDCRQKITLNDSDYKQQKGTFICDDTKTKSGKSMGGECVKTTTDDSGKCQTAYIYEKPAEETCKENSYLTIDDKCECSFGFVMRGGTCISNNQDCKNSFGIGSYGTYENSDTSTCYCSAGYFMNYDKTSCLAF